MQVFNIPFQKFFLLRNAQTVHKYIKDRIHNKNLHMKNKLKRNPPWCKKRKKMMQLSNRKQEKRQTKLFGTLNLSRYPCGPGPILFLEKTKMNHERRKSECGAGSVSGQKSETLLVPISLEKQRQPIIINVLIGSR